MTSSPDGDLGRILCPLDLSERSAPALRVAARVARQRGARVVAFHATHFDPPPYFTAAEVERLERDKSALEASARSSVGEFLRETLGEAAREIEIAVADGLPAEAILRAAEERGIDLIVMGTHGRSGWRRFVLGSVTEHVLHATRVPLLIVPPGADGPPPRRVVCAVDDAPAARRALAQAARFAREEGAELTVLHVREPHGAGGLESPCGGLPEAERAGCALREVTREGRADEQILGLAAEEGCDLLVVGLSRRPLLEETTLGGTTLRVTRHARCPVLAVPDGEPPSRSTRRR